MTERANPIPALAAPYLAAVLTVALAPTPLAALLLFALCSMAALVVLSALIDTRNRSAV